MDASLPRALVTCSSWRDPGWRPHPCCWCGSPR